MSSAIDNRDWRETAFRGRAHLPAAADDWIAYDGSANPRAVPSRRVRGGLWITAAGENLMGEPGNVTIRAGRTLTLGLRSTF